MLTQPLKAELVIEITRGAVKPIPIGIVPFGWEGAGQAPIDVSATIRADLFGSGALAVPAVAQELGQTRLLLGEQ